MHSLESRRLFSASVRAITTELSSVGSDPYDFYVRYDNPDWTAASSIDSSDIRVTGPNGFSALAIFQELTSTNSSPADAATVTARYRLLPPDGRWDANDRGTYTAALRANQVTDQYGVAYPAQTLGSFNVTADWSVAQTPMTNSYYHGESAAVLRFRADGTPVVANFNTRNGATVVVSEWNGTVWHETRISDDVDISQNVAMEIASDGTIHLAWKSISGLDLVYARLPVGGPAVVSTVDAPGDVGTGARLKLDSAGRPWITYFDQTNYRLKLAVPTGSGWTREVVPVTNTSGGLVDFAFDPAGKVTLAMLGNPAPDTPSSIFLATRDGVDNWHTDVVFSQPSGGMSGQVALAFGPDGLPVVAAGVTPIIDGQYGSTNLVYFRKAATAWTSEIVDHPLLQPGVRQSGDHASITFDANGRTLVTYASGVGGRFGGQSRIASRAADGTWTIRIVDDDTSINVGAVPIATTLGPDAKPWLLFDLGGTIMLSRPDAAGPTAVVSAPTLALPGGTDYTFDVRFGDLGGIATATLDGNDIRVTGPGGFTQLAAFVRSQAESSSSNQSYTATYRVTGTFSAAGTYTISLVAGEVSDTVGNTAAAATLGSFTVDPTSTATVVDGQNQSSTFYRQQDASMVIGPDGRKHASFILQGSGSFIQPTWKLVYATQAPGSTTWTQTVLGSGTSYLSGGTSIALDANGRPAITYQTLDSDLRLLRFDGTTWTGELVDTIGNVGAGNSLAFDAGGRPQISYLDTSNGALKYAVKSTSGWQYQLIDGENASGATMLKLTAAGSPLIGYIGGPRYDLKLAEPSIDEPGEWTITKVDPGAGQIQRFGMALGADSQPRFAYFDVFPQDLKFAYRTASASPFKVQTVDELGNVGDGVAIGVDNSGRATIVYHAVASGTFAGDVRQATQSANGSSAFAIRRVSDVPGSNATSAVGFLNGDQPVALFSTFTTTRAELRVVTGAAPQVAPAVLTQRYASDLIVPGVQFTFDRDIAAASLTAADLSVRNLSTNQTLTPSAVTLDATKRIATFTFASGTIIDGNYRATLAAGNVTDTAGNANTSASSVDFFILAGDANRDRKVDFADLVILAQNYNKSGKTFSQGNVNYSTDGKVDFADLVLLAQRYNMSLPGLVSPASVSAAMTTKRRAKSVESDLTA